MLTAQSIAAKPLRQTIPKKFREIAVSELRFQRSQKDRPDQIRLKEHVVSLYGKQTYRHHCQPLESYR